MLEQRTLQPHIESSTWTIILHVCIAPGSSHHTHRIISNLFLNHQHAQRISDLVVVLLAHHASLELSPS